MIADLIDAIALAQTRLSEIREAQNEDSDEGNEDKLDAIESGLDTAATYADDLVP